MQGAAREKGLPSPGACDKILSALNGGRLVTPGWKGVELHANHITYWSVHRYDHCEKQKPPPWPVTVSFIELNH